MPSRDKDTYCIRSVENALFLLEALAEEDSRCSLSQLSQRLGMTKASLFRLMATFESHGYVERKNDSGEYKLGLAAFEVGQKLLSRMTLLHKARPIMGQLVRQCNETVYLVVQRDQDALFLEMADNDQKVKVVSLAGRRFPLPSCAAGKIFLAYDSKKNRTLIKNHPELASELDLCRQQGSCIDLNSLGEGSSSIAVPLLSSGNKLAGCLAIVGPSFRMEEDRSRKQLLPAIKATGEMISARLGYLDFSVESELSISGTGA
jgi:IclR family transcriptional regulator, KDG regulon repressor